MTGLTNFLLNPAVQMGIGMLAGNQGGNRQQAFSNALQGGLGALNRAQMMQMQMAQQAQQAQMMQLRQQQIQQAIQRRRREEEVAQRIGGLLQAGAGREEIMGAVAELDPRAAVGMLPPEITPYQQETLGLRREEMRQQQAMQRARLAQQQNLAMMKAQQAAAQGPESPFAKRGMEGAAYSVLAEAREMERSGQPLSPLMQDRVAIAKQVITNPRFMRSPTGEMLQYTPGMPQFAPQPGLLSEGQSVAPPQEAAPEEAPQTQGLLGGGGTFTPIAPSKSEAERTRQFGLVDTTLDNIARIMSEAKREGDTIYGPVGAAKAAAGGLARSFGVNVSNRAAELSNQLETLKTQVIPILQEDPRVSDADMRRIDKIVGTVDIYTDEVDLRHKMDNLEELIYKALGE